MTSNVPSDLDVSPSTNPDPLAEIDIPTTRLFVYGALLGAAALAGILCCVYYLSTI